MAVVCDHGSATRNKARIDGDFSITPHDIPPNRMCLQHTAVADRGHPTRFREAGRPIHQKVNPLSVSSDDHKRRNL